MSKINVIPMPKSVKCCNGYVTVSPSVSCDNGFEVYAQTFKYTANKMFGITFSDGEDGIFLKKNAALSSEEYKISVSELGAVIESANADGINNGIATLYQLISVSDDKITLPICEIYDKPDSPYRALMIHIPSHIRTLEEVLHYVDLCYLYKVKFIHLHVADNVAYCLPSKKFPKLENHGHNFSWEEIDILKKYCADRNVEIIPEIDVPGHAKYLNMTYPELFSDTPIEGEPVPTIVCIGKEGVFDNLKALFSEVMEMFPDSRYFHIGGDEAQISAWEKCIDCQRYMKEHGLNSVKELYTHSIKVLTDMVLEMGKTPVVWEGFPRDGAEQISRDVIVTAWESLYHLPNELLEEGFTVTNSSWMPLYIVDPKGYHGQFVKGGRWYPKDILCDWNIYTWKNWWDKSYAYEKPIVVEPTDKVIGATLCSWSWGYDIDYPGIKENLPAMCEKIWNVNSTYTIEDFEPALSKLTALADALAPKL